MIYYVNELYHHGILGQKWGVRRYQNKDGTLTAAGRKKYGYDRVDRKIQDKARSDKAFDKAIERRQKIADKKGTKSAQDRVDRKIQDKVRSDEAFDKAIERRQKLADEKYSKKDLKGDSKELAKRLAIGSAVAIGARAASTALKTLENADHATGKIGDTSFIFTPNESAIKATRNALSAISMVAVMSNYANIHNYGKKF